MAGGEDLGHHLGDDRVVGDDSGTPLVDIHQRQHEGRAEAIFLVKEPKNPLPTDAIQ